MSSSASTDLLPLRKGTNPTLVTIAEVGHLVLLSRPKPAALPANDVVLAVALLKRNKTMAKTYRDFAIDQMIATVEEAMSRAIDWWGSCQHR